MPTPTTEREATRREAAERDLPGIGALVEVRGQKWVVAGVDIPPRSEPPRSEPARSEPAGPRMPSSLVTLQSVEDGRYGHTIEVIWEVEPGRRVLPSGSLPEVVAGRFDPPGRLAAFLDALRWSAVTSADARRLQAPFRSGVAVEDYQLEPVARAIAAPRVNLLLADDVGLGKTIEAGLVAEELLLRHRARRIMIVCPAGLTTKWRDEMAEKFGREFTIIDAERCAAVRRSHGSAANPFEVFGLTIVSLPWLRGPKAQRLLDEVLPGDGQPTYPRTFDLLVLDEAHHVAPAAPRQVYAVDSQQTKLIRRLAPHFTHRLFLSATPHNGYLASFTALLEILDDQRFARGVAPDRRAVEEVVVRRLKGSIENADGTPRFQPRTPGDLPVVYPESEREIHALVKEFAALRRVRLNSERGRKATDLVTLLLKKRLFSSPAAFAHTVAVYRETLGARRARPAGGPRAGQDADDVPEWLDDYFDDVATLDDEQLAEAEDDALNRVGPLAPDPTDAELALLDRMRSWADAQEAQPDAKARVLLEYLNAVCRPDGTHWTDERVVVFTEYRDTQLWLAGLLRQDGLAGNENGRLRLGLLHGGLPADEREQLRLAFQAHPSEHPVRILLATDAASEGIDLQNHCHRLVNYDIPFNPNKLEQRIGRIDRYGQRHRPEIRHFVGSGWTGAVDSYEADLEFLSRVVKKVVRMEADLGSVNAVLSDRVQRRMLGERLVDPSELDLPAPVGAAGGGGGGAVMATVPVAENVRDQVRRLRATLDETVHDLGLTPRAVHRVVSTALDLARQQPLTSHVDERADLHESRHPAQLGHPGQPGHPGKPGKPGELLPGAWDGPADEGLFDVPTLTGSWARASAGLTEKLHRDDTPPRQRPVTFDPELARGRDDVVLAHLGHRLVEMSTRLLRGAVSNADVGLHRVTVVRSEDPRCEEVLVGAFARFVLVGADGLRLHEEVLQAGGWLPATGRFRRLENLTVLGEIVGDALGAGRAVPAETADRLAERWPAAREGVLSALNWRTRTRRESLARILTQRQSAEQARIVGILDQFAAGLRAALADPDNDEDALFSVAEIAHSRDELAQFRRDRSSWEERLTRLEREKQRELDVIASRYRDPQQHQFPVAVVLVVPTGEAAR
ncbi:DISARM system SNF2-like helicase DrmD [Frankia sp. Ag45/Mut15]|uniref:DISARM system SNF2-like helicase DrmD n=1 Tax=Frankia umida TaxID=573489 RepID=A0ABT0K4M9_9ACTN|nr:DISARM system SNF2-like helicase DrmD [Frankia umida]MCK9878713.1 DISARM system SNF2-like helicase DrmD [Frankia umida]